MSISGVSSYEDLGCRAFGRFGKVSIIPWLEFSCSWFYHHQPSPTPTPPRPSPPSFNIIIQMSWCSTSGWCEHVTKDTLYQPSLMLLTNCDNCTPTDPGGHHHSYSEHRRYVSRRRAIQTICYLNCTIKQRFCLHVSRYFKNRCTFFFICLGLWFTLVLATSNRCIFWIPLGTCKHN